MLSRDIFIKNRRCSPYPYLSVLCNTRVLHKLAYAFFKTGTEGKHLETAGVGNEGTIPIHKLMESARLRYNLVPGLEEQMVRVCEHDFRADNFFYVFR